MSDRADDAILRILEKDGRLSFNSLAEQIGLSKTPTWARVQNLEKKKNLNHCHFHSNFQTPPKTWNMADCSIYCQ